MRREHPQERDNARLALARVLSRLGRDEAAHEHYRSMVVSASAAEDEHGIPLFLYACKKLLEAGIGQPEAAGAIGSRLAQSRWHSPAEAYLIRDLLETLKQQMSDEKLRNVAENHSREVSDYVGILEQALALKRDFRFLNRPEGDERNPAPASGWTLYGNDPWFVSFTPASPSPMAIAVRAGGLLEAPAGRSQGRAQHARRMAFVTGTQEEGLDLGPGFSGARLLLSDDAAELPYARREARGAPFICRPCCSCSSAMLFGSYLLL